MMDTKPSEIVKALAIYKKRYGSTTSLDSRQLELIIKEIQNDSKSNS